MVDDLNTAPPEAEIPVQPSAAEKPSWFQSSSGRMILAIVGATVIIIAVAAVAFLYLQAATGPSPEPPIVSGGSTVGAPEQPVAEPVVPEEPQLSETFAFRNIFMPSVKAPPEPPSEDDDANGSSSGDSSSDTSVTAGPGELVLVSVQSDDGERTATLQWDGATHTLSEGDTIPDSPWRVVSIRASSATVIFGDGSPIELVVGSSITK